MSRVARFDSRTTLLIRRRFRSRRMDHLMPMVTALGNGAAIWLLCAGAMLFSQKYRRFGLVLVAAITLCVAMGCLLLKPLTARPRPCDLRPSEPLLIPRPTDYSFPSGHTMSSFAAAAVIFSANPLWGAGAFLVAALIAFSRVYLFVHHPSDILGGAALGLIAAKLAPGFVTVFFDLFPSFTVLL